MTEALGSDHASGSRHGWPARRVCRVREGDPSRTCSRRSGSRPPTGQTPRPPAVRDSPSRPSPQTTSPRNQQIRNRTPPSDQPNLRPPPPGAKEILNHAALRSLAGRIRGCGACWRAASKRGPYSCADNYPRVRDRLAEHTNHGRPRFPRTAESRFRADRGIDPARPSRVERGSAPLTCQKEVAGRLLPRLLKCPGANRFPC